MLEKKQHDRNRRQRNVLIKDKGLKQKTRPEVSWIRDIFLLFSKVHRITRNLSRPEAYVSCSL